MGASSSSRIQDPIEELAPMLLKAWGAPTGHQAPKRSASIAINGAAPDSMAAA